MCARTGCGVGLVAGNLCSVLVYGGLERYHICEMSGWMGGGNDIGTLCLLYFTVHSAV